MMTSTTMARPTTLLACCKLYISESRNAAALRAIEQAARGAGAGAVVVNRFTDDAYNRVGYTLVAPLTPSPAPPPLRHAVLGMVRAALEAIDFGAHAGTHPRLGAVDHICFHPLAHASLRHVADLAGAVAADIGDELQGWCCSPLLFSSIFTSRNNLMASSPLPRPQCRRFCTARRTGRGGRWPPSGGSSATSSPTPPATNGGVR